MGTAEECRMVTSFACKENWVERERERISAGFYEWHSCRGSKKVWPAAGEKKIDKKGYSFFPKLTKSKLFLYFSWMNGAPSFDLIWHRHTRLMAYLFLRANFKHFPVGSSD
jgi:hypothetical protein